MIPVTRLQEPRILQEKKTAWTADFVASDKKRPDGSKYAHREVVQTLRSMSHDKCFYCEAREAKLSVDHHIEVSERRDLAFEWSNLYLACDECQGKLPNRSIPVSDCLDPCEPGVEPAAHIAFVAERASSLSSGPQEPAPPRTLAARERNAAPSRTPSGPALWPLARRELPLPLRQRQHRALPRDPAPVVEVRPKLLRLRPVAVDRHRPLRARRPAVRRLERRRAVQPEQRRAVREVRAWHPGGRRARRCCRRGARCRARR